MDQHHSNADPEPAFKFIADPDLDSDPAFHFNADPDSDPDPAFHQSDEDLRPLVYTDPPGGSI